MPNPIGTDPLPPVFELQGDVWMESNPIKDALTWAATTVVTWVVILSVGLLLLRMAAGSQLFPQDKRTTERDEPTPGPEASEDPRSAP